MSEAEPTWTEYLRKLTRRGLREVKLVVSDAHEGIKAVVSPRIKQHAIRRAVASLARFAVVRKNGNPLPHFLGSARHQELVMTYSNFHPP